MGVYAAFMELLPAKTDSTVEFIAPKQKFSFNRILETIAGIFSPALPVLIVCGLIQSLIAVISNFNIMPTDSGFFIILRMMGELIFHFLPFHSSWL